MVIGVVIRDARAVVAALADPETLYVFGVIAARTSKLWSAPRFPDIELCFYAALWVVM
jgi:hypothetical protein